MDFISLKTRPSQHITTCHNGGKAPAAPSTWVSMEDDERVDDVDGIPEALKQMTLGGPFKRAFPGVSSDKFERFWGDIWFAQKFFLLKFGRRDAVHHILGCFCWDQMIPNPTKSF